MAPRSRPGLGWILGACATAFFAGAAAAAERPPIVLVSIDTLRSDRLPAYGYRKVETPAIDALARDGVVFEHAFAHVPLTLPSHLSMLSGLLPGEHGVRDNMGYRFDAARHPWAPAALRAAGYRTGAAVSAYVLRPETGFGAGFERFDLGVDPGTSSDLGEAQRPGSGAVAAARSWLAEWRGAPFFLFVHLYEPHTPYDPGPPWRERYADPYDGEIAKADALVGELVAELRRLDLYRRALIVLVSDHGEGLGDHGEQEHGVLLYREALQVPAIVKLPGGEHAGRRVAAAAQLSDLAPTLLDAAGLEPPAAGGAVSWLALARAGEPSARRVYSETVYPRLHYGWSDLASVVELPFHLIDGPDLELFRLDDDPRETRNLRDGERRTLHALRGEAAARRAPIAPPAAEDPETARKLAALGYLGGTARAEGVLADPKKMLPLLGEFRSAVGALGAGEIATALPVFERMVKASPGMTEAWIQLGAARLRSGDAAGAEQAYREALETSGGASTAALGAAAALRELGRHDEARRHAELALAVAPLEARLALAGISLAAREFPRAEQEVRAALQGASARLAPRILLARTLNGQQRYAEALEALAEAEREMARLPPGSRDYEGLFLARGDAYFGLGRPREAFDAYQREAIDFPDRPIGYVSLALLFHAAGNPAQAVAMMRRSIAARPDRPDAYRAAVSVLRKIGAQREAATILADALRRFPADEALRKLEAGQEIPLPTP
jgi:arylsulfatase A-like enzyme/tetratricopeptide (TPR) repeat protein